MLRMCLIEARPCVLVMFTLRFLCGAALCVQVNHWPLARMLGGAIAFDFAIFSVYLFNGTMDLVEDRANGSRRPIATGRLEPAAAQRVTAVSAAASLALGFAVGVVPGLSVAVALGAGYLYSGPPWRLKRHAVSCALCGLIGGLASYVAGATTAAAVLPAPRAGLFPVALSLWMGLVGSAAKDLPDAGGDAMAGRRTLAVVRGQAAARLAAAAGALAIGTGFVAAAILAAPALIWPAMTLACGALGVAAVSLPRFSAGTPGRCRRPYRAFMVTQYAAHLALLAASLA